MRALTWIGWLSFATLVLAGGWLVLKACELRPRPLYGYSYCPRPTRVDALGTETERERSCARA